MQWLHQICAALYKVVQPGPEPDLLVRCLKVVWLRKNSDKLHNGGPNSESTRESGKLKAARHS